MSMMVSFVLSFFPRDVLDEILKLIESVSEDFPSYSKRVICGARTTWQGYEIECMHLPTGPKDIKIFSCSTQLNMKFKCL